MTTDVDERIRSALAARAAQVSDAELRRGARPVRSGPSRLRRVTPVLAAAAVAAIAVGAGLAGESARTHPAAPATSPVAPTQPPTTPQSLAPVPPAASSAPLPPPQLSSAPPVPVTPSQADAGQATSAPRPSGTGSASAAHPTFSLGYQPLYPFPDYASAQDWQAGHRANGSQPWHLDPALTALSFTQGWLGFQDVDAVTSSRTDGDGAHIGVGYRDANGGLHTAAVLHLVRFGTDLDSPWEIVGSDDDPASFTLDRPDYGSTVRPPMTVGGHIVGVDENIAVTVRRLDSPLPAGSSCCTPAGMTSPQGTDWSATVPFSAPPGDVLTVIASTGGHLQRVERFAIQGVRT